MSNTIEHLPKGPPPKLKRPTYASDWRVELSLRHYGVNIDHELVWGDPDREQPPAKEAP